MAVSWFKFNAPGASPNPNINPLSYTQLSSPPTFVTGSPTVAFIFATTQIIGTTVRPIIPLVSPTLSVTQGEIALAVANNLSSANCYVS